MCHVCISIEAEGLDADEAMRRIAREIQSGADPEHFKDLLDSLLDTEMEERDLDEEERWQRQYDHGSD